MDTAITDGVIPAQLRPYAGDAITAQNGHSTLTQNRPYHGDFIGFVSGVRFLINEGQIVLIVCRRKQ